jgi:hypothetical protein
MLDALQESLSDAARKASGATPRRAVPGPLDRRKGVESLVRATVRVARAREAAMGNVNPQLLLARLADELAEVL